MSLSLVLPKTFVTLESFGTMSARKRRVRSMDSHVVFQQTSPSKAFAAFVALKGLFRRMSVYVHFQEIFSFKDRRALVAWEGG